MFVKGRQSLRWTASRHAKPLGATWRGHDWTGSSPVFLGLWLAWKVRLRDLDVAKARPVTTSPPAMSWSWMMPKTRPRNVFGLALVQADALEEHFSQLSLGQGAPINPAAAALVPGRNGEIPTRWVHLMERDRRTQNRPERPPRDRVALRLFGHRGADARPDRQALAALAVPQLRCVLRWCGLIVLKGQAQGVAAFVGSHVGAGRLRLVDVEQLHAAHQAFVGRAGDGLLRGERVPSCTIRARSRCTVSRWREMGACSGTTTPRTASASSSKTTGPGAALSPLAPLGMQLADHADHLALQQHCAHAAGVKGRDARPPRS